MPKEPMQNWLKGPEPDPPKIQPEQLLERLQKGFATLEELLDDLKCSDEELAQVLSDPKTCRLIRLKMQLAALQTQLAAIEYAPHAIARLTHLADTAEKPEVARRACTTLIQVAGLPTATKAQLPPEPIKEKLPDRSEEKESPEMEELYKSCAVVLALKRANNLDLSKIHDDDMPAFQQALYNFFTKEAKHVPPELIYHPEYDR